MSNNSEYNIESEHDYILLMKSGMMFVFHPELTGEWNVDKITILGEDAEERMKAIGQNGNDGLHYEDDIKTDSTDDKRYVYNMTFEDGSLVDSGFKFIGDPGYMADRYSNIEDPIDAPQEEIEVEEMIDEPQEDKFGPVLESIKSLLDYKNEKYGNSALEPMDIFQGKCKVGQRLDDKLARVKNGDVLKKNDVADLIGYLTLVCVEKGWDSFDEFKD